MALFELVFRCVNQTWLQVKSMGENRPAGYFCAQPRCYCMSKAFTSPLHRAGICKAEMPIVQICVVKRIPVALWVSAWEKTMCLWPPYSRSLHVFAKMLFI